jgi:hypothetical protein
MSGLKVESVGIAQILELLKGSTWLVPSFQRDFVWSESDVVNLVLSIIEARPIGMATLWEQPDDTALTLESILIPDTAQPEGEPVARFSDIAEEERPKKFYAILDGRQRCTAIAMAFGGLRARDARRRFSGRYFLDVTALDASNRIKYLRETEIRQRGLTSETVCIANGLFPLASYAENENLFGQWMRYLQAIHTPGNYPDNTLPESEELARRDSVLKDAFSGINKTLLAVYIVPQDYSLGDICEIFETLNTTGTKVSTVDLLHSWLYSDTATEEEPVLLRDWIEELGQTPGAIGWASRNERPELVAQMVTASYLAIDSEKPEPRSVGRRRARAVTSVKAGDLLATPPDFWRDVIRKRDELANFIGGFQNAVVGTCFPMRSCPYPVTSAIYVALRWYMRNDPRYRDHWSVEELDALFRAFFWRNALTTRYDQGFLTQSATDLKSLKAILFARAASQNVNSWSTQSSIELDKLIDRPLPSRETLIDRITDSRSTGAFGKALVLPLLTSPKSDLLDPRIDISYPSDDAIDLHHIYPRDWCKNNNHGVLKSVLDVKEAGRNFVDSVANLVALSRESNNWWRSRSPGQALAERNITFANARQRFESLFINEGAYDFLVSENSKPGEFWTSRASVLADQLVQLCQIDVRARS